MHIVKTVKGRVLIPLMYFLSVLLLAGCSGNELPQERFSHSDDKGNGYDTFAGYDVRELGEQVEGYWSFYNENESQKAVKKSTIDDSKVQWIGTGKYVVGNEIQEGLYICKGKDSTSSARISIRKQVDEKGEYKDFWLDSMSYFLLKKGDVISVEGETEIAPLDLMDFSAESKDGIYYEGSYIVGKEIPKGEYFMLSMEISVGTAIAKNEKDQTLGLISRFGYVSIENDLAVNLQNCILIPLNNKPEIRPIKYQNESESKGDMVFAAGMYKVGVDLPLGAYKIKNEIFKDISDLTYEGYHESVDYYPGYNNWCGLIAGSNAQAERLGWSELELDSYQGNKKRYLKIADSKGEISYKEFEGLPTVTFTEKDIGNNVDLMRCVLIPERN